MHIAFFRKDVFELLGERRREYLGHTPQIAATARLGQTKAQSQQLCLGPPCGWQGLRHLDHFLLLSQAHRKLDQNTGLEATSYKRCDVASSG